MNITLVEIFYKDDVLGNTTIECPANTLMQSPLSGFVWFTDINGVGHMISADAVVYIRQTQTEKP